MSSLTDHPKRHWPFRRTRKIAGVVAITALGCSRATRQKRPPSSPSWKPSKNVTASAMVADADAGMLSTQNLNPDDAANKQAA
ncbi:hypothetical protein QF038_001924 [Pseudarthrobacter sp. W1I19]|nr:hypothetical protein [Pseudarthrobacter sp. W1I19]